MARNAAITCHRADRRLLGARCAQAQSPVPEIPFDANVELPEAAARHEPRRGLGRRGQLEGRRRGLHALEQRRRAGLRRHRVADPALRQDRQVPARDRQGALRLVLRPRDPLRQGRQPLGHRQGLGHDRPHQPRRARDDGLRPEEGGVGRRRAVEARDAAAPAGHRPVPPADRRRVGHSTATSTSATATSTRASRSSPRTATGSRRSASRAAASSATSTRRTRSRTTRRATSTSATAATAASR